MITFELQFSVFSINKLISSAGGAMRRLEALELAREDMISLKPRQVKKAIKLIGLLFR